MKREKKKFIEIINVVLILLLVLSLSAFLPLAWAESSETQDPNGAVEDQQDDTATANLLYPLEGMLLEDGVPSDDELLPAEEGDADRSLQYTAQPTSREEVAAIIEAYESKYQEVLANDGFLAALEVQKPHWEFAVPDEYMPQGYSCSLVAADEDQSGFGADYYTFFPMIRALVGGSGTAGDPYIISNETELRKLASDVNGGVVPTLGVHYQLGTDINLTIVGWTAIGTSTNPFQGHFNGAGHAITNLRTSGSPAITNYGLFGYLSGQVSDLTVKLGGNFQNSSPNTGIIAGQANQATISNCTVVGLGNSLRGTSYVGAIAGYAIGAPEKRTVITGCKVVGSDTASPSTLTINSSEDEAGGIAGRVDSFVTIENCNALNVQVTAGNNCAGGIAGRVSRADSTLGSNIITGCTVKDSNVTASAANYAGGLIGIVEGEGASNLNTVANCSVSNVTTHAKMLYSGGLIGAARFAKVSNCEVRNSKVTVVDSTAGGVFGGVYNGSAVNACLVEDTVVSGASVIGGFAGAVYGSTPNGAVITESYSAGGSATCTNNVVGGFVGSLYEGASIASCYAQTDVFNTSAESNGDGGFVGNMALATSITNCYSTGAVTSRGRNVGSFVGRVTASAPSVTNCYATGTVSGGGAARGGFVGLAGTTNTLVRCFFDSTTTRMTGPIGTGSIMQDVSGINTKTMIRQATFSGWGVQDNFRGAAGATADVSNPWYIDDDVTYPYLFFQYDGQSLEDTNYFLAETTYADGSGLGQRRADFRVLKNSLSLKTKSAGAAKAYMPHSGTSRFVVSRDTFSNIPGAQNITGRLHSLGGVSRTNIISFGGMPRAVKTSDRAAWNYNDPSTFTKVGDTITYTMVVWNYGDDSDFRSMQISDPILAGLTFIPGSVTVNSGEVYNESAPDFAVLPDNAAGGLPYYSYTSQDRSLAISLSDLPRINAATSAVASYTVTFKVLVEKDAASIFTSHTPKPPAYTGNIKNDAELSGGIWYSGATSPSNYAYPFSDNNIDPVYDTGTLEFIKLGADTQTPLAGAEFSLYFWTGAGAPAGDALVLAGTITTDPTVPDKWYRCGMQQSDATGKVTFQLGSFPTSYPGYYQLVEDQAPSDYRTPTGQWRVSVDGIAFVDSINAIQSVAEDAVEAPAFDTTTKTIVHRANTFTVIDSASVENVPSVILGSIKLIKTDLDDKPLEGAVFAIQKLVEGTWLYCSFDKQTGEWSSGPSMNYTQTTALFPDKPTEAGILFEFLPEGSYRIIEIAAPAGYQTLPEPIEIELPSRDGEGELNYNPSYTVQNSPAAELPASGAYITPELLLMIGLLIAALAAVLILVRSIKSKKDKEDK